MTKWLCDYVVESHACLAKDHKKLKYLHPSGLYELHMSNLDVTPGIERPTLSIQVILNSKSIEEAEETSIKYLRTFLDVLSFITSLKFTIIKLVRIVDWTPGLSKREFLQIEGGLQDPNIPFPVLDERIIDSLQKIMTIDFDTIKPLKRAFHLFSLGIEAEFPDEQFQYFWFAIEILSQINKETKKIPDQCPHCREPLYCNKCEKIPLHRPYPKNAIELLIKKQTENKENIYEMLSECRHALLHGESTSDAEKKYNTDITKLANLLGKIVWTALINIIRKYLNEKNPEEMTDQILFLDTSFFHNSRMSFRVHGSVGTPNCIDDPQIEELPTFLKITPEIHEADDEELPI